MTYHPAAEPPSRRAAEPPSRRAAEPPSRRAALAAVGLALTALAVAGCSSKAAEPFQDSGVAARARSPATVLEMPDGFSNVAAKCDGPNRVYVVFHSDSAYGAVAVAPDDPRCTHAATAGH